MKVVHVATILLVPMFSFIAHSQLTQEWVATYNGPGNFTDILNDMAVDSKGNVYVTGYAATGPLSTARDIVTVMFDSSGSQLWARLFNGQTNNADVGVALVLDPAGNVYVAGNCANVAASDICVIKYSRLGQQEWATQINGGVVSAIALDSTGNVYVAGGINYGFCLAKISSAGSQIWTRVFLGSSYSGYAYKLAVDRFGFLHMAGATAPLFSGFSDVAYVKYDTAGALRSFWTHDGPLHRDDYFGSMAIDHGGNAYVTGAHTARYYTSMGKDFYYMDAFTVKYNGFGVEDWVRAHAGSQFSNYEGGAVVVDGQQNIIVAGTFREQGVPDFLLLKYDSNGFRHWMSRYNFRDRSSEVVSSLAVDGSGDIYVAGRSDTANWPSSNWTFLTTIFDANGTLRGVLRYSGPGDVNISAKRIVTGNSGDFYVGGSCPAPPASDICVIKYRRTPTFVLQSEGLPSDFRLHQNYPNPFNPTTTIKYDLPQEAFVKLTIFNSVGQSVAELVNESQQPGFYRVKFDASNLASGLYFYRIQAGAFVGTKKLLLIK